MLVLIIVGVVVATSGGGDGGSSDCKPVDTSAAEQAGVPTTKLAAVGESADLGCPPTGQLTLVPVSPQTQQNSSKPAISGFALQMNAANLEPSENGNEYVLWLYGSDQQARPVGQETVGDNGNLTGAAPLPTQELVFLQALQKVRLSRVTSAEKDQIAQALKAQQGDKKATGVISFVGTPVLEGSGTELLQQLQQQLQQAQSQAGDVHGLEGLSERASRWR